MPKNKPNHFTVFVNEVIRPEKEAQGIRVPNSVLYNEAFKRYELLTSAEKEYLKNRAKELRPANVSNQFFQEPKTQVNHNEAFSVTDLVAENKKIEAVEKEVRERIQNFKNMDELRKKEFILIYVQCFLETKPNVRPVEIAMVKWSMDKGIIKTFSQLVHPGNIPLGLRSSVNEFAERTHKLMEDKYCLGIRDYDGLYQNIMDFITYDGVVQPLYSFQLKSCQLSALCLEWLSCQVRAGRSTQLRVDPAENLYKELLAKANYEVEVSILRDFLSRHNFDLSDSLRCNFHANNHTEHCAMAFCKKPVYNILNNLSSIYEFKLTENHKQANKIIVSTNKSAPGDPVMASHHPSLHLKEEKVEDAFRYDQIKTEEQNMYANIKMEDDDYNDYYAAGRSAETGVHYTEESFPPLSQNSAIPNQQNFISPWGGTSGARVPPSLGRGKRLFGDGKSEGSSSARKK